MYTYMHEYLLVHIPNICTCFQYRQQNQVFRGFNRLTEHIYTRPFYRSFYLSSIHSIIPPAHSLIFISVKLSIYLLTSNGKIYPSVPAAVCQILEQWKCNSYKIGNRSKGINRFPRLNSISKTFPSSCCSFLPLR